MKKQRNLHRKLFYLLLTCLTVNGLLAEENTDNPEQISLEFLEFLGNFSTAEGDWIDPMEVNDMLEQNTELVEAEKSE